MKRSFANRRQKLEFLKRLSQYIQQCLLKDKCSVWIAQAEGRAKTGKDFTDTALLKMLALCKSKVESFSDIVDRTNIIPVSIAYEYDPCIKEKVSEIYAKQNGQEYIKSTSEDLDSIVKGFLDFKGRVNVTFGNVISEGIDTADCLAKAIDHNQRLRRKLAHDALKRVHSIHLAYFFVFTKNCIRYLTRYIQTKRLVPQN